MDVPDDESAPPQRANSVPTAASDNGAPFSELLSSYNPPRASSVVSSLDGTFDAKPSPGPRRGSFPSDLPPGFTRPSPIIGDGSGSGGSTPAMTKADLHATFNTNLAPKYGVLPSQKPEFDESQEDQQTDSDPEFKNRTFPAQTIPRSTPTSNPTTVPTTLEHSPSINNTIEVSMNDSPMPPPALEPKTSDRRVRHYTLPDGTIVSGKGLGRGRPGVKRGPRKRGSQSTAPDDALSPHTPLALGASVESQQSQKRRRSAADSSNIQMGRSTSISVSSASRESSVEYNPVATETRSGRKTQKPTTLVPQPSDISSPTTKKPRIDSGFTAATHASTTLKSHPKIKRRVYRGKEQFALCEHCLRSHGPAGNVIVFCDACNKCWHQRCHDPQVPKEIVTDTKAEWFCADCDRILHGGKKSKKNILSKGTGSSAVAPPVQSAEPARPKFDGPLVGGFAIPKPQKLAYLNSLTKEQLIQVVMGASEIAPGLPLFQTLVLPPAPVPQPQFTSNYVTPVSRPPTFAADHDTELPDEGYDDNFDEHAALYPRPGNGIKLPPESVDMHMLLESKDSKTFSHWIRGMPGREFSGTGNVVAARA